MLLNYGFDLKFDIIPYFGFSTFFMYIYMMVVLYDYKNQNTISFVCEGAPKINTLRIQIIDFDYVHIWCSKSVLVF